VGRAVFLYGTLRDPGVLGAVLGRVPALVPARLKGFRVRRAAGADWPFLREDRAAQAEGLLARALTPRDLARLEFYEAGHGYDLAPVTALTADGPKPAQVFLPRDPPADGGDWTLGLWQARDRGLAAEAAVEAMGWLGTESAAWVARRWPMIRARAEARLAARARPAPRLAAPRMTRADVEIHDRTTPYRDYFNVDDYRISPRRFDNSRPAPVSRAAFVTADAVTVLPYDAARDLVLVVEQFRIGPFARGDLFPWVLEPVAGRCDANEPPEATARREAREEAGLALGALERIGGYYPSPGALSEFITSYIGQADLAPGAAGLHGLAAEHEDIRTRILPFAELEAAVLEDCAETAPLLVSVLWLGRHRARLRAAWGAPA
jgi:nudix-type nucleoside diphosphatase (YffH/AdpP family)